MLQYSNFITSHQFQHHMNHVLNIWTHTWENSHFILLVIYFLSWQTCSCSRQIQRRTVSIDCRTVFFYKKNPLLRQWTPLNSSFILPTYSLSFYLEMGLTIFIDFPGSSPLDWFGSPNCFIIILCFLIYLEGGYLGVVEVGMPT